MDFEPLGGTCDDHRIRVLTLVPYATAGKGQHSDLLNSRHGAQRLRMRLAEPTLAAEVRVKSAAKPNMTGHNDEHVHAKVVNLTANILLDAEPNADQEQDRN